MKWLKLILIIFAIGAYQPVSARDLSLDQLRNAGIVAESMSGYVVLRGEADSNIKAFVNEINNKRKAYYQDVAQSTGQSLNVVEKLAAEKNIARLGAGSYYKDASGGWKQK